MDDVPAQAPDQQTKDPQFVDEVMLTGVPGEYVSAHVDGGLPTQTVFGGSIVTLGGPPQS